MRCIHCLSWHALCPISGGKCETFQQHIERVRLEMEELTALDHMMNWHKTAQHHYIDPMARALLVAEYVRAGNMDAAQRTIRETAEYAHGNALLGHGPLGQ